jgi:hypothetical protein
MQAIEERDRYPTLREPLCFLFKKGIHGRFMYYKRILIDIPLKVGVRVVA